MMKMMNRFSITFSLICISFFFIGFHEFNLMEFESNWRFGIQLNQFKFNSIQVACNFIIYFHSKWNLICTKSTHFFIISLSLVVQNNLEPKLNEGPPMIMKELWLVVKTPIGILSTIYIINLSFNSLFYGFFPLQHWKG
jgi:hypothetical protein